MKRKYFTATSISLILLALLANQLPVFGQTEDAGNVHGTVIDENGDPIYKVKVSAISTSGSVEYEKYTDEDGYFRFALNKGTYDITFEKDGYTLEEKRITAPSYWYTDPDSDPIKMGDIELTKAIQLETSSLNRLTSPGKNLDIIFTIINNNIDTEKVSFEVKTPDNWSAKILDSTSEVKEIYVTPGSTQLTLCLKIPKEANQSETVTLTTISTFNETLELKITPVTSTDDIEMKTNYVSVTEELGQSIQLPLKISNNGEVDRTVKLITIAPEEWSINFLTDNDMAVKTLLIEPGNTQTLTVEIDLPDNAIKGDYSVSINAVDENDLTHDTVDVNINLREPTSDVEVISTFSDVTIEAGGSISFPIAIWNRGSSDTLTLLSVDHVPNNWDTVFITDDVEVSSILIGAGESITLKFEVEPPKSVETGKYNLNVVIETSGGYSENIPLKVSVEGSYELVLELSTLYTTATIGNSVSFSGEVTNLGATPVTTLYLDLVLPEDWEASISPVQVKTLDPRDSTRFTVVVETTTDTEAGDYLVTVQAVSDQLTSDEVDIRITAQASNTWGYIGLGLAVIAIAGAYLLFKRFKRR